jgi:IS1 transposase
MAILFSRGIAILCSLHGLGISPNFKESVVKGILLSSPSSRFCVFRANESHGKETGETAHVERWNNTLRQRLGRFVRKTLSFSKSDIMHNICLHLFLHRYNQEKALAFM